VRDAADVVARAVMANISGPGIKLVLPTLLKGLEERQWRSKQARAWHGRAQRPHCSTLTQCTCSGTFAIDACHKRLSCAYSDWLCCTRQYQW
jgi:hypothetical protein